MNNKPKIGLKRGFTLIELLVVMSIIMILTVIAVANFSTIERSARIGFAADTLVAILREGQVLAKSGRRADDGSGTQTLQCQAVKVVSGSGPDNGLYTGQSTYIGLPKDASAGVTVDTCAAVDNSTWIKNEIFDGKIVIIGDGSTQEFYFKPPFGQINEMNSGVLSKAPAEVLKYAVGVSDNPDSQQKVEFDLITGNVMRVK